MMAIYYHSISTDSDRQHDLCPVGLESWCKHRRAESRGEPSPDHNTTIPAEIADIVKTVFINLSTLFGWQSTQLCKRKEMFKPLPLGVPFVQVVNEGDKHWLMTSNVKSTTKSVYDSTVKIYDSNWSQQSTPSLTTIQSVCSFLKSPAKRLLLEYVYIPRLTILQSIAK